MGVLLMVGSETLFGEQIRSSWKFKGGERKACNFTGSGA